MNHAAASGRTQQMTSLFSLNTPCQLVCVSETMLRTMLPSSCQTHAAPGLEATLCRSAITCSPPSLNSHVLGLPPQEHKLALRKSLVQGNTTIQYISVMFPHFVLSSVLLCPSPPQFILHNISRTSTCCTFRWVSVNIVFFVEVVCQNLLEAQQVILHNCEIQVVQSNRVFCYQRT